MDSVPNAHTPCCSAPNPLRNNLPRIQVPSALNTNVSPSLNYPMNGTPQPPSCTPQPVTPHSLSFRHGTPKAYLFPGTPSAPQLPCVSPLPALTPGPPGTQQPYLGHSVTPQPVTPHSVSFPFLSVPMQMSMPNVSPLTMTSVPNVVIDTLPHPKQFSLFLFPENQYYYPFHVQDGSVIPTDRMADNFKPFYISPEMTKSTVNLCTTRFDGKCPDDNESASKMLFAYIRQSIVMQHNDRQLFIYTVNTEEYGTKQFGTKQLIIIRPDLFHKNTGSELFFVAIRNDLDEQKRQRKTEWKIEYLVTRKQLALWLKLDVNKQQHLLPQSSRREHSQLGLREQIEHGLRTLSNLQFEDVKSQNLNRIGKGKVRTKTALNRKCKVNGCKCREFKCNHRGHNHGHTVCSHCGHGVHDHGDSNLQIQQNSVKMSQRDFKSSVRNSWNATQSLCPVVVNRGKRTWIEWKKFVALNGDPTKMVAISLKWNEREEKWEILKVIDCDADRVFGQYLLLGDALIGRLNAQSRQWTYMDLKQLITTNVDIQ